MEKSKKIPATVILGQTASGKSALAMGLCEKFDGEIISADSMQVYRRMDIGTAKPSIEDQKRIRHHLINICEITEKFSAADFIFKAKQAIFDINSRQKQAFIVGGTGLYTDMLFNSSCIDKIKSDETIRNRLNEKAQTEGNDSLYEYLKIIDPIAAQKVHPNNLKRVIRYIEIFLTTGLTPTEAAQRNNDFESEFLPLFICLSSSDKEPLYARINDRVDEMLKKGLESEAKSLWLDGIANTPTASQAIGYKEFFPYFSGLCSLDESVSKIKQSSRNYAKRQLTYFKKLKNVNYIDISGNVQNESENLIYNNIADIKRR
ncbi:MAG: tRNA (adenosine(37)-N6)-dimethylallyltransferase MiaA [Clostridia bacterium]